MKKTICFLLAMMMLVLFASLAVSEDQGTFLYVKTPNGKGLNVRSSMSTEDKSNIIGSLSYGTRIITYGSRDGWTLIDYGNKVAYIMTRYLTKEKPAPYQPADPDKKSSDFSTAEASTVTQMNTLVASPKYVTPYTVLVRPTRASGWVYMRWFPSKSSEAQATFGANYELTVLAELKDWYQVEDPVSGRVGFVYKSYVQ